MKLHVKSKCVHFLCIHGFCSLELPLFHFMDINVPFCQRKTGRWYLYCNFQDCCGEAQIRILDPALRHPHIPSSSGDVLMIKHLTQEDQSFFTSIMNLVDRNPNVFRKVSEDGFLHLMSYWSRILF